jgi:DNA polymerase III delta prime subunit
VSISEIFISKAIDFALEVLGRKISSERKGADHFEKRAEVSLSNHLKYVSNWSKSIQFATYGSTQDVETQSVELKFDSMPRMFRSRTSISGNKDEASLLSDNCNYLLLGDPGSGKTTTLKRIARKILFTRPELKEDIFAFPILIRLKELTIYKNINEIIAEILGFTINFNEVKHVVEQEVEEDVPVTDANGREMRDPSTDAPLRRKIRRKVKRYITAYVPFIMNIPLDDFVSNYLDEASILVLIDGYDELESSLSSPFEKDIEKLARKLTTSKIIMTCRSGHCNQKSVEGFDTMDILPLDRRQIEMIASQWLDNNQQRLFFKEFDEVPYKDLGDRPLFITLLLIIFKREGELPDQPSEVYQRIVDLLLRDWDADRKIIRRSKYSGFDKGKKALFLAELAFQLTCEAKLKRFDSEDLIKIYDRICGSFKLPKKEAVDVAREIESHSGLIVASGFKHYEFSHLSLQEYLCAEYIVRSPLDGKLLDLLVQYPEPAAVAIALSSNPSAWFTVLILNSAIFKPREVKIEALIRRLLIEHPYFRPDKEFGYALLTLILQESELNYQNKKRAYRTLFRLKTVRDSVRLFLREKEFIDVSTYSKDHALVRFILYNPVESRPNSLNSKYFDVKKKDLAVIERILGLSRSKDNLQDLVKARI